MTIIVAPTSSATGRSISFFAALLLLSVLRLLPQLARLDRSVSESAFHVACFVVGSRTSRDADDAFEAPAWDAGFGLVRVFDADLSLEMCEKSCDAIVFSASSFGSYATAISNCTKPLLTWEEGVYRATAMTGPAISVDAGCCSNEDRVTIIDEKAPLAAGLTATATLFAAPRDLSWASRQSLGAGAHVVAVKASDADQAVVFYYCTGDEQHGGGASPSLRIGLPPHYSPDADPVEWTAEGHAILRAALSMLQQAVGGEGVIGCGNKT